MTGRTLSTPITQDDVGAASDKLSAPCGVNGPVPVGVPVRLRYAMTLPVAARSPPGPETTALLRSTWSDVPW